VHVPPIGIVGVDHFSSSIIVLMAPKGTASKDTTKSNTREIVESKPIYLDTQLFIEKESYVTWQKVNEIFSEKIFNGDLEDWKVYVNV